MSCSAWEVCDTKHLLSGFCCCCCCFVLFCSVVCLLFAFVFVFVCLFVLFVFEKGFPRNIDLFPLCFVSICFITVNIVIVQDSKREACLQVTPTGRQNPKFECLFAKCAPMTPYSFLLAQPLRVIINLSQIFVMRNVTVSWYLTMLFCSWFLFVCLVGCFVCGCVWGVCVCVWGCVYVCFYIFIWLIWFDLIWFDLIWSYVCLFVCFSLFLNDVLYFVLFCVCLFFLFIYLFLYLIVYVSFLVSKAFVFQSFVAFVGLPFGEPLLCLVFIYVLVFFLFCFIFVFLFLFFVFCFYLFIYV